jgi:hypothetical protein
VRNHIMELLRMPTGDHSITPGGEWSRAGVLPTHLLSVLPRITVIDQDRGPYCF